MFHYPFLGVYFVDAAPGRRALDRPVPFRSVNRTTGGSDGMGKGSYSRPSVSVTFGGENRGRSVWQGWAQFPHVPEWKGGQAVTPKDWKDINEYSGVEVSYPNRTKSGNRHLLLHY